MIERLQFSDPDDDNEEEVEWRWQNDAACLGKTEMMFPKRHKDITYIPAARALCKVCPVRKECEDYALTFPTGDMHGVWAGMTPRQLAAEQRRRGIKATRPTIAQMLASMEDKGKRSGITEVTVHRWE